MDLTDYLIFAVIILGVSAFAITILMAAINEAESRTEFCIEHGYLAYKGDSCVRWGGNNLEVLEKRKVCFLQDKMGWCNWYGS